MPGKARIYNGEKKTSSISGAEKLGRYMQKSETGPLSYIIHKNIYI